MTTRSHLPSPDASSTASFDPSRPNARFDGWTPSKQFDFIEALANSGCVIEAARSVGMTPQSAYRLRQRGDAASFAVAWQQALTHAVHRLADAALSRALHGVATPIFYKGEQIGERRKYDENLTRFLLRLRAPENYEDLPRNMKVNSLRPAGVEFDRAKQRLLDPDAPGLDRDLVDQDGYDQNADGEDGRDEDRYGEDGRDEDGYDEDSDDCAADGSELS